MSRTHRDQRNYYYKHFTCPHTYQWLCNCWPWDYMFYRFPPPSYWNRDCRREERAHYRGRLQRGEWDAPRYRRPYYW